MAPTAAAASPNATGARRRQSARGRCRPWLVAAALVSLAAGCGGRPDEGGLFERAARGDLPRDGKTYGATVLDLDGDAWPDLLVSRHGTAAWAFLNRGGLSFRACPAGTSLPSGLTDLHGAAAADFDGDGDDDVYLAIGSEKGTDLGWNQLWLQEAPLRLRNVAAGDTLLGDPVGRGRGALAGDWDGDRRLELLVMNYQSQARLLAWTGAGWRDDTGRLPLPAAVPLWTAGQPPPGPDERARATWVHAALSADFDGDGRAELLALGRFGWSGLWRAGAGGRFEDVTSRSGLKPALWPHVPVHAAAGDVDGDGRCDLVLVYRPDPDVRPRRGPVELWRNRPGPDGAPRFEAAGADAGLAAAGDPAAALLGDFDNDGALDLYVVRQAGFGASEPPNLFFRGDGEGRFAACGPAWGGTGPLGARPEAACAYDLDRDGDLDLLTANGAGDGAARDAWVLYRNRGGERGGLTLELASARGTPHGLGARLELTAGGRRQVRQILCQTFPLSSCVVPAHFGLGRDAGPFTVEVRWPGGGVQRVALPGAGAFRLREGDTEARPLPARPGGAP